MAESITEKIQALLRLAKSDNPHEAGLALQRAMALADKHAIDLHSLSEEGEGLDHAYQQIPTRLAREWKEALNTVQTFFHVNLVTIKRRAKLLIVGRASDIEVAQYVITFLVRSCRECLAKWSLGERRMTHSKRAAFIDGFFTGIFVQLRDQRRQNEAEENKLALVLVESKEARQQATAQILGPGTQLSTVTVEQVRQNRRAQFHGFSAGKATQINPGLKGQQGNLSLT